MNLPWLASQLRKYADRIDHAGAPKLTHWTFTFEDYRGMVFREDGRGCRIAYLGDVEYGKAHAEAGDVEQSRKGAPVLQSARRRLRDPATSAPAAHLEHIGRIVFGRPVFGAAAGRPLPPEGHPADRDDSVPAILNRGCHLGVSLTDEQARLLMGTPGFTPGFAKGGIVNPRADLGTCQHPASEAVTGTAGGPYCGVCGVPVVLPPERHTTGRFECFEDREVPR